MNSNFPTQAFPRGSFVPQDTLQMPTFASAGPELLHELNQRLGLHMDIPVFENLKRYFFLKESKNPTLGEIQLLGHLMSKVPLAEYLAPVELYTDSSVIMETWADIMAGHKMVYPYAEEPCTLSSLLSLPEIYAQRQYQRIPDSDAFRICAPADSARALNRGYEPCRLLDSPTGIPRVLYRKNTTAPNIGTAAPEVGDIIMVLPATELTAINAFLQEHPLAQSLKFAVAVQQGSILQTAVAFCRGRGLSIQLTDLVPPADTPEGSHIRKYLEAWESEPTADKAYLVFCVPSVLVDHVGAAMVECGFRPHMYGRVTKQSFVSIMSYSLVTVKLKVAAFAGLKRPLRTYGCTLPLPAPIAETRDHRILGSALQYLEDIGCSLSDCTIFMEDGQTDGYTPTVQSVLSLCCDFAAAGICYDNIRISPVIYYDGLPESPLLLSTVCGLYRAATELGIPLVDPKIMFKNSGSISETASLVLSLVAYSDQAPCATEKPWTAPDRPLALMALDPAPDWADIRGMLFAAARCAKSDASVAVHSLQGQRVLSLSHQAMLPDAAVRCEFFEEHQALLSQNIPLGFLVEGSLPSGSLHIGMTRPREEDVMSSLEQDAENPPFTVTPCAPVTINHLINNELKRRKEITAMEKIKAFEPLSLKPRTVLLDTDIGPDCDDVGALAVLIYYAKQYGFPIGGICNCTSNKAGNGVIDAICRRCGMDTPPLGQWHGEGFMDGIEHCKYNTAVAEAHSEAYRNGTLAVDDEVTYYRKRLAAAQDGDVMIISIGMFNNLAALLDSPADDISPLTGMELIKAKVYALVSMAAILPQGRECNVVSDYQSCERVFNAWPTPIYLSDFHIGVNVKTGYPHITDPNMIMADPLPMSYHLYTQAWNWEGAIKGQNASYDLTAVQFAALGIGELYDLDTPGDLEFYAEIPDLPDATRFIPNPLGNKIFMTKKVPDEAIADSLQKILNSF